MYGAFLEKDSTKDCHVPSKDSIRDKEIPTCITYQKMFEKVHYRVDLLNHIYETEKKIKKNGQMEFLRL